MQTAKNHPKVHHRAYCAGKCDHKCETPKHISLVGWLNRSQLMIKVTKKVMELGFSHEAIHRSSPITSISTIPQSHAGSQKIKGGKRIFF